MVKLLVEMVNEGQIGKLEKVNLYEIDLGERGYLTASDILSMDPECESDGCCYSGGSCYSNCDM